MEKDGARVDRWLPVLSLPEGDKDDGRSPGDHKRHQDREILHLGPREGSPRERRTTDHSRSEIRSGWTKWVTHSLSLFLSSHPYLFHLIPFHSSPLPPSPVCASLSPLTSPSSPCFWYKPHVHVVVVWARRRC